MEPKLSILYQFLQPLFVAPTRRRGKTHTYNWPSMLLFFMVMCLKGIHSYKSMAKYAQVHYGCFGWQQAPCRKTIVRRFEALPQVVYRLMPLIAQATFKVNRQLFSYRWAFIDKSVFRAQGGVWHRTHRLLGIVPHRSIDFLGQKCLSRLAVRLWLTSYVNAWKDSSKSLLIRFEKKITT